MSRPQPRRRLPKASLYKGLPPDQTRPPRATFAGISPRPRSGDNAPGMQAWRGNDRQETVNFKPLVFSEIHAAGDKPDSSDMSFWPSCVNP